MYKRIVSILGKKNQSICGILNVAQQRPNRRDGIRYLSFPQFPRLEYHRLFDLLIYWVPVKICQEGDVFRYHLANSAAFISILGLFRLRNLLFYQRPESLYGYALINGRNSEFDCLPKLNFAQDDREESAALPNHWGIGIKILICQNLVRPYELCDDDLDK